MTLAAIFIIDHNLFENSIVLNFGGKYIYEIKKISNGQIAIKRAYNDKYIENFFDESGVLLNISAIVGSNGAGKTSILSEIVTTVTNKRTSNLLIYENGEKIVTYPNQQVIKLEGSFDFQVDTSIIDINTVYYSPFLDFRPEVGGVDLSFDAILGKDLASLTEIAPPNGFVLPMEVLKRANYMRIRNLKVSELAIPIKEFFDFPDDNLHRVTFTRYKIDADSNTVNFENTPMDFRSFLQILFRKIRDEADIIRNLKRDTIKDQFVLQKTLLKNYILMDVYCLLIKLMEIDANYLQEGHFDKIDSNELGKLINNHNSYDLYTLWFDDYYYSRGDHKNLPHREVLNLIDFLFDYIDNIEYDSNHRGSIYFDWSLRSIFLPSEKLDKLYELERDLINSLGKYYAVSDSNNNIEYKTVSQIPNYINLEPSLRNLSSGETAMLNLFSRIHEYFDNNVISEMPTERKYKQYLLLLDEADLGFHPIWKRHFVKTLIEFSTKLFKKIDAKVQIIFTTHDPLSLSDLPSNNIVYVNKSHNNSFSSIISDSDTHKPRHSFGANLTDLLADSFFLQDSLMGDFARDKIQNTINWLHNENRDIEKKGYHKELINLVDEPILRTKLEDMYFEVFKDEIDLERKKRYLLDIAQQYGLDINFEEQ